MPEWDKRKAPWNARMGQVGQEQGSSSSGQQLLLATAPNMEQATEAAPNIISQLLLQDKKEELLEHPILADTDTNPAAETQNSDRVSACKKTKCMHLMWRTSYAVANGEVCIHEHVYVHLAR